MPSPKKRRRRALLSAALTAALIALAAIAAAPAGAFTFSPSPKPPPPFGNPPPLMPLPNGYLNGPCGVAVDSGGRFYVADHYHDRIDVYSGTADFTPPAYGDRGYVTQLSVPDPDTGPCYLAVDSAGDLYVGDYHGAVRKYSPDEYPPTEGEDPPASGTPYTEVGLVESGQATGLALDTTTDHLYVAHRTAVTEYDSSGALVGQIGTGSLSEGYGVAVSGSGEIYVADAADNTVEAYDPSDGANFPAEPSAVIDGSATPAGAFTSLRDSALAVDRVSGRLYVLDLIQPTHTEQPRSRVHVFSAAGAYLGHLEPDVVDGAPSGLAVNNFLGGTQGRVYVTSGNTHFGGVYGYPAPTPSTGAPLPPSIPPPPIGGVLLFPTTPVGAAAAPPGGIPCDGDACQVLPPVPVDPTLTTLLEGLGNPAPRYVRYRRGGKAKPAKGKGKQKGKGKSRRAAVSRAASASQPTTTAQPTIPAPADPTTTASTPTAAQVLLPGAAGFTANAYADGGQAATQAGSHPYSLEFGVGLDQGGGEANLRELRLDLPPGLLLNPAFSSLLCSPAQLAASSCPDSSQLGTVEVAKAGAGTRRAALYELSAAPGTALQLGALAFGEALTFNTQIRSDAGGTYFSLTASELPQSLRATALKLVLWGTPWDASHNPERGSCLNETEPGFALCKRSVGEPLSNRPLAFLTLPTECAGPLSFAAQASSWQAAGSESASGGDPAPMDQCESLGFQSPNLDAEGQLTVQKASSSAGFIFSFTDDDPGLVNPRARLRALMQKAVVELPKGVTLNPSLGAGLETCSPAQLANERASAPAGSGCPNGSKIGTFNVRVPFYDGVLKGGVYLAKPDQPGGSPGADNPYDTLIGIYLVAKSADRGILISLPGKLIPDPSDGTLTATFDNLPQLPYTDLEINFRSGQRAPLISPSACGPTTTKIALTPWAQGASPRTFNSNWPITSGIDNGPCPTSATPPFAPGAIAGGVNANVGSYTPYYVHLSRKDTEQEITSYSLILPKGITGKLAGIPFCSDAAIEAARGRQGFAEIANPSCPPASQVGRTDTGYGVGPALTYAPGRIYLAGPYHGSPLSLVTINAATVGPFDLGTIVIRSAFDVDEHTAQLEIDSTASDPIPHIIDGIPLHLRDVRVYMDRFQFTHNPSSCEPSALESTLTGSGASFATSADDSRATVSKHFQLLNCLNLGFRPKLGLRLRGPSRRGAYPSLRASFVSRGAKDSNLKRIEVEMPHSLFLAQNHIRTVCTREQFAAERCPQGSIYGKAMAQTLLFDTPLRGNVYLRSSTGKLPDLVADLRSGSIRIVVEGRILPGKHGGILTFFDNLPDAPIDRFTMTLGGGKHGLLQNSSDICANPPLATVSALGQNNVGARFTTTLRGQCKAKQKAAHK